MSVAVELEEFKSVITASYNSGVFDPVSGTHTELWGRQGVGLGLVGSLNDPAFHTYHLWLLLILADTFFLTLLFRLWCLCQSNPQGPVCHDGSVVFPWRSPVARPTLWEHAKDQDARGLHWQVGLSYRGREPWTAAVERSCLCTVVQTPSTVESMTHNPEENLLYSLAIHSCILNPDPQKK